MASSSFAAFPVTLLVTLLHRDLTARSCLDSLAWQNIRGARVPGSPCDREPQRGFCDSARPARNSQADTRSNTDCAARRRYLETIGLGRPRDREKTRARRFLPR